MKRNNVVVFAQFSSDGQRVVTVSKDSIARVRDFPTSTDKDTADDIYLLADLAEAIGSASLVAYGKTEVLTSLAYEEIIARQTKIAARFADKSVGLTPLQRFLKWIVEDQQTRTISPLSNLTAPEWVETPQIEKSPIEKWEEELREREAPIHTPIIHTPT